MSRGGLGLTGVPTAQLTALLRLLYQGRVPLPVSRSGLLSMGLHPLADEGDVLLGLDDRAARAVLVAVIAERRTVEGRAG